MKKITLLLLGIALSVSNLFAKRVVAYTTYYGNTNNIQYGKITDIVYGFADVSTIGSVTIKEINKFNIVLAAAKKNGVNIHLSVGGANNSANFSTLVNSPTAIATFATNVNNMIVTYGLAGVDIDWEFPAAAQSYKVEQMLKAVKEKIGTKELSVAVAATSYNTGAYTAGSDTYIDFYNLMVYDEGLVGKNHSSYAFAQQSISYWANTKNIKKSKMILGLPFYGRSINGWATELEAKSYSQLSNLGGGATVYNSDSYVVQGFTYYYNGKATIQKKCNLALSEGLEGVMIWEIGQDRTDQYSLLGAIDEIMKAGVSCSEPNLGFTKSLCGVSSVVLDAGVSGTNFSYKWSKDNVVQSTTTQTYTAAVVGEYCVEYIHSPTSGNQCPTRKVCVDVTKGGTVQVENVERCDAGSVTLKTSGQYSWFTASAGGTSIHKGGEYTTTLSKTTTYYIDKPAVSETVGRPYTDGNINDFDKGWTPTIGYDKTKDDYRALVVDFLSDFTIDYVTVYSGISQDIEIRLVDSDGKIIDSVIKKSVSVGEIRVPLGFDVTKGENYRIEVKGAIWLETTVDDNSFYDKPYDGILTIKHMAIKEGWAVSTKQYLGIYNWEVSAGASCGRTPITATIKTTCSKPVIAFTKPSANVSTDGKSAIDLEVTATDADGTISTVSFVIKKDGVDYKTLTGVKSGDNYTASFTATETGNYTITAVVTDNDNNEVTKTATSSISATIETGLEELAKYGVQVYPNPFDNALKVDLGTLTNSTISIYSIQGQEVITLVNVNGQFEIGQDLQSGIYLLQIITDNHVVSSRIVKQ